MSAREEKTASLSPAVNSAAEVLIVLSEEGGVLPAAAIARRVGRAKSTVANILAALHDARLLERDERGRYGLGLKVVELGGPHLAESDWISDFQRMCLELPTARYETISLASLNDDEIIYLGHHDGTQPVRWVSNVGAHLPAVATALGITMLSTLGDDDLDAALESITEYPEMTEFSYRSEAELREAIDLSREQGFAIGDQLNTMGLCSISRPLLQGKSRVYGVGAILLSFRVTPDLQERLLEDLDYLARRLLPPISAS